MKSRTLKWAVQVVLGALIMAGAPGTKAQVREHRIPFKLHDGLIYVEVGINGHKATLLVDSGATLTTLGIKFLPLGLEPSRRITIHMAKGSVAAYQLPVNFALDGSKFRRDTVIGEFTFLNADGVLGADVLSNYKSVNFDFRAGVLTLAD
jgi:predicted aspartyl protease